MYNKLDVIRLLVVESNPEILGISETPLNDGIDDSEIHIPNFSLLRKDRRDGYGGVALYVNNRLTVDLINLPDYQHTKVETLWVKLSLPHTRPIHTRIFYGPSVCSQFFEELEVVLDQIMERCAESRSQGEIVCVGDFNCDALKHSDWQWKKLHGLMSARHLSQIISKPTRVTDNSETLIDHVWTTHPDMYTYNGVLASAIYSDHSLIYAGRKAPKLPKGHARIIRGRSYRSFNEMDFSNDLGLISWADVRNAESPGAAWASFEETLGRVCAKHAPFKQLKIPNRSPDWFNDEYLDLRKQLVQIRSRAQFTRSRTDWTAFSQMRNRVNNLAQRLKREFYETTIINAGSDSKKLWKAIKTLLPSSKNGQIGKN